MTNKPKKKHNWMAGFVITKPMDDMDKVEMQRSRRIIEHNNKVINNNRGR